MPTLLIALASALLFAALVTETISRFWPDSYLALMVVTFVALVVNGLFNARLKQNTTPTQSAAQDAQQREDKPARDNQPRNSERGPRDRSTSRKKSSPRNALPKDGTKNKPARELQQEKAPRGPQETGTVKWFNRSKGYGFIIRDNGDEVFVHQRSIVSQGDRNQRPILQDGQKVSFVVAHLEKGAQAEQVSSVD